MNQIVDKINEKDSIIEADPLHNELRIFDFILNVRMRINGLLYCIISLLKSNTLIHTNSINTSNSVAKNKYADPNLN
jgi:hypothetical protein